MMMIDFTNQCPVLFFYDIDLFLLLVQLHSYHLRWNEPLAKQNDGFPLYNMHQKISYDRILFFILQDMIP